MDPKIRRTYVPKVRTMIGSIVLILLLVIGVKLFLWTSSFIKDTGLSPGTIVRLMIDTGAPLKATGDRTNVLLLGVGGGDHEGSDLTDTIMVLSFQTGKHTLSMISVPRDVWSDTLKDKVNSGYHYGEEKKKGGGMVLSKAIIEDVVGLPIHYAMVIDFSGFQKIIDLVGGIDVNVSTAFTDSEFPIPGKEKDLCDGDPQYRCRYETVTFTQGWQHMDGARALTYVRSRHAEGADGTDFARGNRQQEVLVALKNELVSTGFFLAPSRVLSLKKAFDDATQSDMRIGELATVGKLFLRTKEERVQRVSIESFLVDPPLWMYGRYVLIPKEDFSAIHSYIRSQLPK